MTVKEFVVYTALRILLFAGTFALVTGIWWLVADEAPIFWVVVISFVVSGVASYFLLNAHRERFAQVVQRRAERATARFEEARSREDHDAG